MVDFDVIGLTLPRLLDPAVAIAVGRAGGIGVLDLQWGDAETWHETPRGSSVVNGGSGGIPPIGRCISRLMRFCKGRWGVKLNGENEAQCDELLAYLDVCTKEPTSSASRDARPKPLDTFELVILTDAPRQILERQITRLRAAGVSPERILLEIIGADVDGEVPGLDIAGIDGFVAKGEEAGGVVGVETTFVLLQRLLKLTSLPVWAQGGIGLHSTAACRAGGAAGVVLDVQLSLSRESALPEAVLRRIGRVDGSETITLGERLGYKIRIYNHPQSSAVKELKAAEQIIEAGPAKGRSAGEQASRWKEAIRSHLGWGDPDRWIWPLGQDSATADDLARRFKTAGGIVSAILDSSRDQLNTARLHRPLADDSALARSHRTRFPIVQGPMTRVSDNAAFASQVAKAGGLPLIALALSSAARTRDLLEETRAALGDRPWGVGILGFVPLPIRTPQLEVIKEFRPAFVVIAGGRPDQALQLEREGIATYLHTPSPALLKIFFEQGIRRFVFEGRECGGHVGPRSSFALWDAMTAALLSLRLHGARLDEVHVLFAGGIHDAVSASMVAALAAPLAEAGVKVGVLLGTAYLFTREAVSSGAIMPGFQAAAIDCQSTALLESGAGHASRCARTPFVEFFEAERGRLTASDLSVDEIRNALEDLCLGRLRLATKGVTRRRSNGADPAIDDLLSVDGHEQRSGGMYMIGQLAALRHGTSSIEDLHHDVCVEGSRRLDRSDSSDVSALETRPCDVAIIGIATLLPQAPDARRFWENILGKIDAITEIPPHRFDWRQYYDPDPAVPDKIYSKWGGFLNDVPFDPVQYGIPPNALQSIEPMQLLTLEAVRAAIADAGYGERPFARSRTSVVLGVGGGLADLGQRYGMRSGLPMLMDGVEPTGQVPDALLGKLPSWTEDSFPGLLLNVAAGRVANRFDLGGVNCTVDAACASSLAAIYVAARELSSKSSDLVIAGGLDTVQNPFAYLCFSKTKALSPRGRCRPFDASADGIVISEGLVVLVLKRLADAERDGDRIYAVIKSVAGSSDGRDKGLTAPRPEGQVVALRRAYESAGISPATIGLIEAHGTGTVAGDGAEVEALKRVFPPLTGQRCAIGSVKSMIGHTKCAAGAAGLVKAALALHEKVLPPTIHVEAPNPKADFANSPFFVNTEILPWLASVDRTPRRAGVSAFGFGGTNFHAVLEEYADDPAVEKRFPLARRWPSEMLVWSGHSSQSLRSEVSDLSRALQDGAEPELVDLAAALWQTAKNSDYATGRANASLVIIASTLSDLRGKLAKTEAQLAAAESADFADPSGIYFRSRSAEPHPGKVAFLFPGQGSQQPGMLAELAVYFREVRQSFETADRVLAEQIPEGLSSYIFPPPQFTEADRRRCLQALSRTEITQPAMGAACLAMWHLLQALGLHADVVAGHSYGEYVALGAAGVFSDETLYALSEARGRCLVEAAMAAGLDGDTSDLGTMLAVFGTVESVAEIVSGVEDVWIANVNSPRQTMLSGTREGIAAAAQRLATAGVETNSIPVGCGFHSPLMAGAQARLAAVLAATPFLPPQLPIFSNTTAAPYPQDSSAAASLLVDHLVRPVRFRDEVEAMYRFGVRTFVEVGPRAVLTGLVGQILTGRQHLAVATCGSSSSLTQLQHMLARLFVEGIPLSLDRLYQGRASRLNFGMLLEETRSRPLPPSTWLVDGGSARRPGESASHTELPMKEPSVITDKVTAAVTKKQALPPSSAASLPRHEAGNELSTPELDRVIVRFQETMTRFLETQQQTMLSYLRKRQGMVSTTEEARIRTPVTPEAVGLSASAGSMESPAPTKEAVDEPNIVDAPQPGTLGIDPPIYDRLLAIIGERTGYPSEMLNPGLDLEADLGIDSIKRVEILGAFRRTCPPGDQDKLQSAMEKLTSIKTLGGLAESLVLILDSASSSLSGPLDNSTLSAAGEARPPEPTIVGDPPMSMRETTLPIPLPRFLPRPVEAALPSGPPALPSGLVLMTDDGRGAATALAAELRCAGWAVAILQAANPLPGEADAGAADVYRVDLSEPRQVESLVRKLRGIHGQIAAVLHLLPLGISMAPSLTDTAFWRQRTALEIKGLFNLAKAAGGDLRSHSLPKATLLAATCLGGDFGVTPASDIAPFPTHGGVTGFTKSVAVEWPEVRCKVVDFETGLPAPLVSRRLMAELSADPGDDHAIEVGYQGAQRIRLCHAPFPLPSAQPLPPMFEDNPIILVTGGARGITAMAALTLTSRCPSRLILVGLSKLPADEEEQTTAASASPLEIKRVLIDQMRRANALPEPAAVEAECARLLRDREIRANLRAMHETGSQVDYRQCDVADEKEFGRLIDELYASYGRIDGVIHGAGVIEDRLVEHKEAASFDRVIAAKVYGALLLAGKLRPESLRFLALFSSIAGRVGNRGQADYAAANEVLNKLAAHLDARWPSRVVAINWGPWDGSNMVSEAVRDQFIRRGVQLIKPSVGCAAFIEELVSGSKGQPEVIRGDGPWAEDSGVVTPSPDHVAVASAKPISQAVDRVLPLLDMAPLIGSAAGKIQVAVHLDPSRHLYLNDHCIAGKSVFPAAMAVELMAELAQKAWPDRIVTGVKSLRVCKGIVLDRTREVVRMSARHPTYYDADESGLAVDVEIGDPARPDVVYFRGTVCLGDQLAPVPESVFVDSDARLGKLFPFAGTVAEAYRDRLFHGPLFHSLARIRGMNKGAIVAAVHISRPANYLATNEAGSWIVDPVLLDAGPQLAILWAQEMWGVTALPSRFGQVRMFDGLAAILAAGISDPLNCRLVVDPISEDPTVLADYEVFGPDGRLVLSIEGLESTGSRSLNRLVPAANTAIAKLRDHSDAYL
jgi:acyl transferase domain-containing protein/NAD(P)H-dependent flavin oxidoreductase YrpB (nitropropane dioxygenase family)/NAD(P)-dependent dehydrogenase (short-subunit alcohol dehydrogenase family)